MSEPCVFNQIKESLNGRPDQPIVFGVCQALSKRYKKEPWVFRLAAIVLTLFWTLPALAAYIVLSLVLTETEMRTRKFFSGLAVVAREQVEKLPASLRALFESDNGRNSSSRGY